MHCILCLVISNVRTLPSPFTDKRFYCMIHASVMICEKLLDVKIQTVKTAAALNLGCLYNKQTAIW